MLLNNKSKQLKITDFFLIFNFVIDFMKKIIYVGNIINMYVLSLNILIKTICMFI